MTLADTVRHNIRHLLEVKGWTYADLPFPSHYVSHVLTGKYGLSTKRIDEFAAAFRVHVSELCKIPPGFRATEESDR